MKCCLTAFCAVIVSLAASAAPAQQLLEDFPGYFPEEHLSLLSADDVSIEINLQGALLQMVAAFAGKEDPEFAQLVGALEAIRVRSGEPSGSSAEVRERLDSAQRWLVENGWLALVRVREEGEEVYVYSREQDGVFVGFTVLAVEDTEVTTVNLIGHLDPNQLAAVAEGFDLGVLDDIDMNLKSLSGDTDD